MGVQGNREAHAGVIQSTGHGGAMMLSIACHSAAEHLRRLPGWSRAPGGHLPRLGAAASAAAVARPELPRAAARCRPGRPAWRRASCAAQRPPGPEWWHPRPPARLHRGLGLRGCGPLAPPATPADLVGLSRPPFAGSGAPALSAGPWSQPAPGPSAHMQPGEHIEAARPWPRLRACALSVLRACLQLPLTHLQPTPGHRQCSHRCRSQQLSWRGWSWLPRRPLRPAGTARPELTQAWPGPGPQQGCPCCPAGVCEQVSQTACRRGSRLVCGTRSAVRPAGGAACMRSQWPLDRAGRAGVVLPQHCCVQCICAAAGAAAGPLDPLLLAPEHLQAATGAPQRQQPRPHRATRLPCCQRGLPLPCLAGPAAGTAGGAAPAAAAAAPAAPAQRGCCRRWA